MTKQNTSTWCLLVFSALLIVGSAVSFASTSEVGAQEKKCKFGVIKVVKIGGNVVEICNYVWLQNHIYKVPVPPVPPECLSCPVIVIFNPEIIERMGLKDLMTIVEGPDFDNVTLRIPHDIGFGNVSVGPGMAKAP